MDLQTRLDEIALQAIMERAKTALRLPDDRGSPDGTACLDQICKLLESELDPSGMTKYAATCTYRAVYHEQRSTTLLKQLSEIVGTLERAETGAGGNVKSAIDALQEIVTKGHPLIASAVSHGRQIERKVKASASSKRSKDKMEEVKRFALQRYKNGIGKWKNPSQARRRLWPDVFEKAKLVGWKVSETEGPETLYRWLLEYEKRTRSAS